jgi:hypothetical protein
MRSLCSIFIVVLLVVRSRCQGPQSLVLIKKFSVRRPSADALSIADTAARAKTVTARAMRSLFSMFIVVLLRASPQTY